MRLLKSLLAVVLAAWISFGQDISISGTVTDTAGDPLSGAYVSLEKIGIADSTDDDGVFTLEGDLSAIYRVRQLTPAAPWARVRNNACRVYLPERTLVTLVAYNLQGQAVATFRQALDAGSHSLTLPRAGAGIYVYRVTMGNRQSIALGTSISGSAGGAPAPAHASNPVTSIRLAKTSAVFSDVIAVTVDGYLNYRVLVNDYDTAGIAIVMLESAGTVSDTDGNVYQTVRIGSQEWTVENLRTTKLYEGTSITLGASPASWGDSTGALYTYYNGTNDVDSILKYGALYNWYAVNTRRLAPAGWHVPTDAEWDTLQEFLIANGYNWDTTTTGNKIAKSLAAGADWAPSTVAGQVGNDPSSSNTSGFSALPGGYCDNGFRNGGSRGGWWSTTALDGTDAYLRLLGASFDALSRVSGPKSAGFSVRLVKGAVPRYYIITPCVNDTSLGVITPSTPQEVDSGAASPEFVFKSPGGFQFDSLTLGGARVAGVSGIDTSWVIDTVLGDDTLKAWFTRKTAANIIKDADGNIYHKITIGTQQWMLENLRTAKLNDGTPIAAASGTAAPGYCWYDNNPANKAIYGALYNGHAVNSGKLAPEGWHVPTVADWDILKNYLIANGHNWDGTTTGNKIAKSLAATTNWENSPTAGRIGNLPASNNSSGFTAYPGGYFSATSGFGAMGQYGNWWTATTYGSGLYARTLSIGTDSLVNSNSILTTGYSVRLVKDLLDLAPPSITVQPLSQSLFTGQSVTFSVTASGYPAPTYQWKKDGADIPSATSSSHTIASIAATDSGSYTVVVMNSQDTVTSAAAVLTVIVTSTMTDQSGITYQTVRIGNQEWMAENLRTTRYNDNADIPLVTAEASWNGLTAPAYCFYGNTTNADTMRIYGALYNWHAVNTGKLAPAGWHVATDADWTTLENYLAANGQSPVAKALAAKTLWPTSTNADAIGNDLSKNNSSGFTAYPGGDRYSWGNFQYKGIQGKWWTATVIDQYYAYSRQLQYVDAGVDRLVSDDKSAGLSVRLVKN